MEPKEPPNLSRRSQELLDRMLAIGTFGRLTVRGFHSKDERGKLFVRCDCSCGQRDLRMRAKLLLTGNSQSCGCLRRERVSAAKSGLASKHPAEYTVFCGMKGRCYNPNDNAYVYYGGRGITICQEWLHPQTGFATFLADMGPRPPDLSINRIDNDGPYAPSNCVWATDIEQARNKSSNRLLRSNNEIHCVQEWAELKGMDRSALKMRLKRGWSVDESLSKPIGAPSRTTHYMTLGDITLSVSDWERKLGWKPGTIKSRLKHGWTEEQTLSIPLGEPHPNAAERRAKAARLGGMMRMAGITKKERRALSKQGVRARKEKASLTATP